MVSTDARQYRSIAAIALFIVVGGLAIILRETSAPWEDGPGQAQL